MSYSRWNPSVWYVFWMAGTDAQLAMWHAPVSECRAVVDYDDLAPIAGMTDDTLAESALASLVPDAPRGDVMELLEYVREFCDDVERQRAKP